MAKTLSYKKSTTTTLKAVGFVDAELGVMEIEGAGVSKKLSDLLKDFDGELVEINIKDSVMNFKYDVYNKCGDCEELTYKAYFVPVKKGKLKELLPINPVFNNKNAEVVC